MPLEKKYVVSVVRAESKEVTVMEILEDPQTPPMMLNAAFRLRTEDYEALGLLPVRAKLKITIEVEKAGQ